MRLADAWRSWRLGAGWRGGGDAGDPWTAKAVPLFVGGTGRSGTTVTARLLGFHPALKVIRTEVKFVTDKGGLFDLVEGRTRYPAFEAAILDHWYSRDRDRGLHRIMDRSVIEAALPRLRKGLGTDPSAAAGEFVHRLLDPIAVEACVGTWIEMTPTNVEVAPQLLRSFPDMRLVHSVRDGRDVACSVVKLPWGPNELHRALDWWARRLERGFAACDQVPADRVLVTQMEDLLAHDRERTYARLLAFVGLDDDPTMHTYFDERMPANRAHIGRWREDVPPDELASFEAHYLELAERIAGAGRPYHPEAPAPVPA